MKSPKHVFISFKTEEREFASKLKTALINHGYKVWWQEEIQCGQEWHGEIDKAIAEAGAVIVLWSNESLNSTWVRHEASQAIIKKIYTPVRIEVMEIESPFNREQATDMNNWTGDTNAPGFINLLARLNTLMPKPLPFLEKAYRLVWNQRIVIVLSIIALLAIYLLLNQGKTLDSQNDTLVSTLKNIQNQGIVLNSQITKQEELIQEFQNQSSILKKQIDQQNEIFSLVQSQSIVLKSQLIKQEDILLNVQKALHPIQDFECWIAFDFDSSIPEIQQYLTYLNNYFIEDSSNNANREWLNYLNDADDDISPDINQSILRITNFGFPSEVSSFDFRSIFLGLFLEFRTSDNTINPADLVVYIDSQNRHDEFNQNEPKTHLNLYWDIKLNKLRVEFNAFLLPKYLTSNGKIVSVPDIEKSNLSIRLNKIRDNNGYTIESNIFNGLNLNQLGLWCSGQRFVGIKVKKKFGIDSLPLFTMQLIKSNN